MFLNQFFRVEALNITGMNSRMHLLELVRKVQHDRHIQIRWELIWLQKEKYAVTNVLSY